uniref:AIPP2-like SPOC-like domain-containing protein n=1 Tax=Rhizophora mucronata TaxID=61149 RepID=A0A2P2QZJ8_RHIMU
MICQRFSIKAVLEDAELLIFTSTILPIDYWRFQAKFYLWGVFKGKQPSCLAIDAVPFEEKEHIKTITWDAHCPISTLSNDCNGSCSTRAPHR